MIWLFKQFGSGGIDGGRDGGLGGDGGDGGGDSKTTCTQLLRPGIAQSVPSVNLHAAWLPLERKPLAYAYIGEPRFIAMVRQPD